MQIIKKTIVVSSIIMLSACGTSKSERALSGGGIGAGVGAVGAAVVGANPITGALVGGGVGAVTGAVTNKHQINLGN